MILNPGQHYTIGFKTKSRLNFFSPCILLDIDIANKNKVKKVGLAVILKK